MALNQTEIQARRKKLLEWRLAYPHSHYELRDPHLRSLLANELWVLRRRLREIGASMTSESVKGIRMGLETMARRVQDVNKRGIENVYAENFAEREQKLMSEGNGHSTS